MATKLTIGFAGMTHLGLVSAVATAAHGFEVVGYDASPELITRLRRAELPVFEPAMDDLLAANAQRVRFTDDRDDLGRCEIVYIAADVPTDDAGRSELSPIVGLIRDVRPALGEDALVVILCQVPPGFTRSLEVPHDRLLYQVETLVFGRAIERAMRPERFIVGCADPARPLPARYRTLLEAFGCPILPMRYESAELAKISINFCLVATLSAANVLAEVSEQVGADWAEIVPALRLDRRIGQHSYLTPGLGIAGGNLERDLRTVLDIAERTGTDRGVIEAWIANSRYRKDWCWRILRDHVLSPNPKARIGVLGLAYKENTRSTKNSAALALLAHLEGREVRVHDPVVSSSIVGFAKAGADPLECAAGADALVLVTPWPQYRGLAIGDLARVMAGRVLIDPHRLLDGTKAAAAGFRYFTLGMPALGLEETR